MEEMRQGKNGEGLHLVPPSLHTGNPLSPQSLLWRKQEPGAHRQAGNQLCLTTKSPQCLRCQGAPATPMGLLSIQLGKEGAKELFPKGCLQRVRPQSQVVETVEAEPFQPDSTPSSGFVTLGRSPSLSEQVPCRRDQRKWKVTLWEALESTVIIIIIIILLVLFQRLALFLKSPVFLSSP